MGASVNVWWQTVIGHAWEGAADKVCPKLIHCPLLGCRRSENADPSVHPTVQCRKFGGHPLPATGENRYNRSAHLLSI